MPGGPSYRKALMNAPLSHLDRLEAEAIHIFRAVAATFSNPVLLYSVGTEVLSVEMLKLWSAGQAEKVCVIGLMMVVLVIIFRGVQILLSRRINPLKA